MHRIDAGRYTGITAALAAAVLVGAGRQSARDLPIQGNCWRYLVIRYLVGKPALAIQDYISSERRTLGSAWSAIHKTDGKVCG